MAAESSRIRAACTAIQSLLLNDQIVLDLPHKAVVLGRRILHTYCFSVWWFHMDVSVVPLACKVTEHLWTVCLGLSKPNRTGFWEKRTQLKERTCLFPLYQWLWHRNLSFEGPQHIASWVRNTKTWHFEIWACSDNGCWYRARLCVPLWAVTFHPVTSDQCMV